MYHSYDQLIRFVQQDDDCRKLVAMAYAVFMNHKNGLDEKKALRFCHRVAVKLCRVYNKSITKAPSYSRVFTPSTIDRLQYFVYETAKEAVL